MGLRVKYIANANVTSGNVKANCAPKALQSRTGDSNESLFFFKYKACLSLFDAPLSHFINRDATFPGAQFAFNLIANHRG